MDQLELELELRPQGEMARKGGGSLLSMDSGDEFLQRPHIPEGAEELVNYYEKQLAAAQVVQERLQRQLEGFTEERASLEAGYNVEIASLRQQLAAVYAKADQACQEASHSQEQVLAAREAVERIVASVTQLAEHLDEAGATPELTHSFEEVAKSTQSTFEAVSEALAAQDGVVGAQQAVKAACVKSDFSLDDAALGGLGDMAAALKELREDAQRMSQELYASQQREQQLNQELSAAQVLFSGLEAEVVSLQQDQAQAAAKLQLSYEELVHGRTQLLTARQLVAGGTAGTQAADVLEQGVAKLDAHLGTVRDFLEGLAMPVSVPEPLPPAPLLQEKQHDTLTARTLSTEPGSAEGSLTGPGQQGVADAGPPAELLERIRELTTERDDARQQLDLVAANVAMLEQRLEEVQVNNEQLQQQVADYALLLKDGNASEAALLARIETLEKEVEAAIKVALAGASAPASAPPSATEGSTSGIGAGAATRAVGAASVASLSVGAASSQGDHSAPGSPRRPGSRIPAPPSASGASASKQARSGQRSLSGTPVQQPTPTRIPRLGQAGSEHGAGEETRSESGVAYATSGSVPSQQLREHQQQVEQLTETITSLQQQVQQLQDACQASDARADALQQEKASTATLLHQLGDEQAALAEQLRSLEVAKDGLEVEREQLHSSNVQLQAQLAELSAQASTWGEQQQLNLQQVQELAAERDRLAAQLLELSVQGKDDDAEVQQLRSGAAILAARAEALEAEVESLQARLAEADARAGSFAAEQAEAEQQVQQLTARIAAVEALRDKLTQENDELVRERDEAVSMAAAAGAAGAAAAVMVAHGEAQAEADQEEAARAHTVAATAAEVAALQQRLVEMEAELASMASSTKAAEARAAQLASDVDAMSDALQEAEASRVAAQLELEALAAAKAAAEAQHTAKRSADAELQAAMSLADAVTGRGGTPSATAAPTAGLPPSVPRVRSARVSFCQTLDEQEDQQSGFLTGEHSQATSDKLLESPVLPLRVERGSLPSRLHVLDPCEPPEQLEQYIRGGELSFGTAGASGGQPRMLQRISSGSSPSRGQGQRSGGVATPRGGVGTPRGDGPEVAQLQAAVCNLLVNKALSTAQLRAEHEAELSMLQAAHEAELSRVLRERDEVLEALNAVEGGAGGSARASMRSLPDAPPAAGDGAARSELAAEDSQLRAALAELRAQNEQLTEEHQLAMQVLRDTHDEQLRTLQQEASSARARTEELQAQLSQLQSDKEELQAQLSQLQSDKEVEEQSLQSLTATKAWMTEEIRSLQSDLRDAREKLQQAEAELTAAKSGAGAKASPAPSKAPSIKGKGAVEQPASNIKASPPSKAAGGAAAAGAGGASLASDSEGGSQTSLASIAKAAALAKVAAQKVQRPAGALPSVATKTTISSAAKVAAKPDTPPPKGQPATLSRSGTLRDTQQPAKGTPAALSRVATARRAATLSSSGAPPGAAEEDGASVLRSKPGSIDPQVGALADQLSEAAMQAALAEAKLESITEGPPASSAAAGGSAGGGDAAARAPAGGMGGMLGGTAGLTMEQTDMMMETVVLHGELDELNAKHRKLQEQLGALAEELATAVLQAALADAQLEHTRLQRTVKGASPAPSASSAAAGSILTRALTLSAARAEASAGEPKPGMAAADDKDEPVTLASLAKSAAKSALGQKAQPAAGGTAGPAGPSPRASSSGKPASQPSQRMPAPSNNGEAALPAASAQPQLQRVGGGRGTTPLDQTLQLHNELKTVAEALGELFDGGDPANAPSRQALSTLRPAVFAAMHINDNVRSALEQQQRDVVPASAAQRASTTGSSLTPVVLPPELERARAAYRDAREVYHMLRADAEELNSRLWRWGGNLRDLLTHLEQEYRRILRERSGPIEDAVQQLLRHQEQALQAIESERSDLQGDLRAAHGKVLRRNHQVAKLQDMLVQLSEQVTMFEGVITRCEVLSADLASQAGVVAA